MTKGTNEKFEVYAFAAQYTDLASGSRETTFYEVGPDLNIYLENLTDVEIPTKQRTQSLDDSALTGVLGGAMTGLAALMALTW